MGCFKWLKLKFWKREPSAEEQLDQFQLAMYEEAMTLEKTRSKGKRIYEV
jgi:hypothetical protein